jgi:nucleotide-binding universal stress UspA family protein
MYPLTGVEFGTAHEELLREASDALAKAAETIARDDINVETELIDLLKQGGDVEGALAQATVTWGADLLVVGARQHGGLLRWIEGATSESLAKDVQCSILIVPASYEKAGSGAPNRILFAVDGSMPAMQALQYGIRFARPGAHLKAIYVVDRAVRLTDFVPIHVLEGAFVEEGKKALAAAERIICHVPGHAVTAMTSTERTSDDVPHAITREASRWHADLLVMGTHGLRGMPRWVFGSVAGRVARITQTPLLLVQDRHDD